MKCLRFTALRQGQVPPARLLLAQMLQLTWLAWMLLTPVALLTLRQLGGLFTRAAQEELQL